MSRTWPNRSFFWYECIRICSHVSSGSETFRLLTSSAAREVKNCDEKSKIATKDSNVAIFDFSSSEEVTNSDTFEPACKKVRMYQNLQATGLSIRPRPADC